MKANEFVKKFGWEEARKACSGVFSGEVVYKRENINIDDLKRLVESHELVFEHGSIDRAKKYTNSPYTAPEVKCAIEQAIADVESCK